jgi:hypothetical protein
MDADDLISPYRFEKQLAILDAHPEIDLVTTGICSITNDKRPVGVRCGSPHDILTGRSLLRGHHGICHGAILGRKSWFLRNPYDLTQHSGDFELWCRAFSRNDLKIYVIDEPLYYYREENNVVAWKLRTEWSNQRQSWRKYGYLGFGRWELAVMTAKSHCKALIVRVLSASGMMNLLISQRNIAIEDKHLLEQFNREIKVISNTNITGMKT